MSLINRLLCEDVYALLSQDVGVIITELSNIKAKLIPLENNTFMIKFDKDSQLQLQYPFQGFLKGMIFRKFMNEYKILSVSYHIPSDVSLMPNSPETHEQLRIISSGSTCYYHEQGTLIKMSYYDDNWRLSTNGVHDAFINPLSKIKHGVSFGEKFSRFNVPVSELDTNNTYVFNLNLTEDKLYHVATINNYMLTELDYHFPNDCNVSYYQEADQLSNIFGEQPYMMVYNYNGYTYRYLFPSLVIDNIINSIVHETPYIDTNHINEYAMYQEQIKNMYQVVYKKYWDLRTKQPVNEPHIRETISNIHRLEYMNYLQEKKLSLKIQNVIHYFKKYSNPREIKYILNDIKIMTV